MTKAQQRIYDLLMEEEKDWTIEEILAVIPLDQSVIYRHLQSLIKVSKAKKVWYGKYKWILDPKEYLQKPYFERNPVAYNPEFLRSYIPNVSSFFGVRQEQLREATADFTPLSTFDYMKNRRAIENLLIDLSYASSHLEGNTYSYLDTEVLVKYNQSAEWKSKEETQMILNHKNAIEYILRSRNEFRLTKQDFCEIHTLLAKWLIHDTYLGIFRSSPVQIGGSRYSPPDIPALIEWEFELFLEKLRAIENPLEQSLFILVFIPYFQAFIDINKRTSRLASNIPLIAHGLPPLSLIEVKERDYINAILAIYELHNTDLMADLFVENYLHNMKRYI